MRLLTGNRHSNKNIRRETNESGESNGNNTPPIVLSWNSKNCPVTTIHLREIQTHQETKGGVMTPEKTRWGTYPWQNATRGRISPRQSRPRARVCIDKPWLVLLLPLVPLPLCMCKLYVPVGAKRSCWPRRCGSDDDVDGGSAGMLVHGVTWLP
jgi:hypothetical protein